MTKVLRLEGINRSFGGRPVLKEVSFDGTAGDHLYFDRILPASGSWSFVLWDGFGKQLTSNGSDMDVLSLPSTGH